MRKMFVGQGEMSYQLSAISCQPEQDHVQYRFHEGTAQAAKSVQVQGTEPRRHDERNVRTVEECRRVRRAVVVPCWRTWRFSDVA